LRAKNRRALNKKINTWTKGFSKKELGNLLGGKIPFGPVNSVKDIFEDQHIINRNMILEIPQPFDSGKSWKVAGNPVKFKGFDSFNLRPPNLGEHKNYYSTPLNSSVLSQQKNSFQPKSQHYKCKVTLTMKDNNALEFYANSFTWLNSKKKYLICSVIKGKFKHNENLLESVNFYFSKISPEKNGDEKDIDFLNLQLSKISISNVALTESEVETLISAKI